MQFLRNGSAKIQSFVYDFVENYKLLKSCQNLFLILTVSEATAVRSDHGVMSGISNIGS